MFSGHETVSVLFYGSNIKAKHNKSIWYNLERFGDAGDTKSSKPHSSETVVARGLTFSAFVVDMM